MAYDLLSDYCWVMVGSQRRKIMNCLSSEKLPSQVKKETGLPFSNVSRVLAEMVEKELVQRLGTEERFRLYSLTEKGNLVRLRMKGQ